MKTIQNKKQSCSCSSKAVSRKGFHLFIYLGNITIIFKRIIINIFNIQSSGLFMKNLNKYKKIDDSISFFD